MKRIVAYNRNGDLVAKYRTIKVAAKEFETTAYFIRKALLDNKQMRGVKFMYEQDYEKAVANAEMLGWGWPYELKRKRTKAEIIEKEKRKAYRRINIIRNFKEWAKTMLDWLVVLGDKYKKRGDYHIFPTIIGDFYKDAKDKEIALFASLVLSDNDKLYSQVTEMRTILTEHPAEWFRQRGFVALSTGEMQHKRITGNAYCEYWKIAKLFDRLWHIVYCDDGTPTGYALNSFFCSIKGDDLDANIRKHLNGHDGAADELHITIQKVRLLIFVLCTSDGIGCGLWDAQKKSVKVPIVSGMAKFMRMVFPDYLRCGNIDDAIDSLGFHKDFLYIYLGWKELCTLYPRETQHFASVYYGWTQGARTSRFTPSRWRAFLPPML